MATWFWRHTICGRGFPREHLRHRSPCRRHRKYRIQVNALDKNIIDQLASRLADAVPGDLRTLRTDMESNFRSLLQTTLGKLDLVTREEFEVQRKVLERTREKLERLEKALAELQQDAGELAAGNDPQDR